MILNFLLFSVFFILGAYYVFRHVVRDDYREYLKLSSFSTLLEVLVFVIHANSIYLILPTAWPDIPELPSSLLLRIMSIVIFVVGLAILLIAWFGLGSNASLGKDENQLNTDGIYKFSRNPQLLAYGVLLSSVVVMFFSWLTILWILLYIIASYFMIKSEEEFLKIKYGQEYEEYFNSVPRIL